MLQEFHDLMARDDKEGLFRLCFNRCHAALSVMCEHEKAKLGSLWDFDARYRAQTMAVLYERFAYAMAMIVTCFAKQSGELNGTSKGSKNALRLSIWLSGAVDEVFHRIAPHVDTSEATAAYCEADFFDENYGEFWENHRQLADDIEAVRREFHREVRTFLHGFDDADEADDDTANRDCFHMMRMVKRWHEVDTALFLVQTKRNYLPLMIELFLATPKHDLFARKPAAKWWACWKR